MEPAVAPLAAPPAPPVVAAPAVPPVVEPTGLQKAAQVARQMIADRAAAQATAAATTPDPVHPAPVPAEPAVDPALAPPVEGEVPPEGEPPLEGAEPAAETEILVSVPGTREGEPDIEIAVTDQKVADRINALRNNGMRREELKRQMQGVDEARAEVAAFDDAIQLDPIGVVMERMGDENRVHMAKALMTDPAVLAALSQDELFADALNWDEGRLALASERIKNLRYEIRDRLTAVHQTRSARQKLAGDVLATIERIPPATWSEEQVEQFIGDAFNDVKDYIARHGQQGFRMEDLPLVLQRRLRAMGMSPLDVAERLSDPGNGGGQVRVSAPAAASPPATPATPARQVRTAAELKAAAEARARGAAIPTGAHGAPVAGGPGLQPPPKGSGLAGAKAVLDRLRGR